MAAGCDREGPVGAPELAGFLDLKAGVAKPLLRLCVVRRDHGDVSQDGRRVPRGEDQVDLRTRAGIGLLYGFRDLFASQFASQTDSAPRAASSAASR
jgi:hypothetical protein